MAVEERATAVLPAAIPANAAPSVPALFQPRSLGEAVKFAEFICKSELVPAAYRGKPADIIVCWQWCEELGISLQQGMSGIAVINGKTSLYGDLAIALVRRSPLCEYVHEEYQGDGDSLTAVCTAARRGQGERTVRFSVADAKKAGLWGKSGPWTNYPKRMLQLRARGYCLRDLFPDVLKGLITAEEARDYPDGTIEAQCELGEPAQAAPVAALGGNGAHPATPETSRPQAAGQTGELVCNEPGCARAITTGQYNVSIATFGRALCPACQRKAKAQQTAQQETPPPASPDDFTDPDVPEVPAGEAGKLL